MALSTATSRPFSCTINVSVPAMQKLASALSALDIDAERAVGGCDESA